MYKTLQRMLGFEEGEGRPLLILSALVFLLTAGIELGRIGRDSYFLTVAGADDIPLMYIFIALLTFFASVIYGKILGRVHNAKLMIGFQALGSLAAFSCWIYLLLVPQPAAAFPFILFCVVDAYILFILVHFWTLCNSEFHVWQGTRLFPVIGAAGLAGTIGGGGLSYLIASFSEANHLFVVWAALLTLGSLVCLPLRSKANSQDRHTVTAQSGSQKENLWRQPVLRTLAYMALPMWVVIYIIEFSYYEGMNRVFRDQSSLASFMGAFVCISAFIGLLLQLTLTRWLLNKVSVGSAALFYPFTLTLGSLCLLVFSLFPQANAGPLDFGVFAFLLIFARFCDIGIYYSVYDPAAQVLFYALPERIRARGRSFLGGIIFPASIASAGLILLWFRHLHEPVYNVAFVAISLGFLLIILGLNLTPDYLKSLLGNFQSDDESNRSRVIDAVSKLPESDIHYVLLDSLSSQDLAEARFALEHLFQHPSVELFEDIQEILPRVRPDIARELQERMVTAGAS